MEPTKGVSRRTLLLTVVLVGVLSGAFGFAMNQAIQLNVSPRPRSNVFFVFERFSGTSYLDLSNVVTNIGENQTRERFSTNCSATDYALYWISIGNCSAAQTRTQLTTQHDRDKGTIVEWMNSGDAALNCTYKWEFASTVRLNATGWHWSNTGDNNLYSVASFADQTFNNGENLTVRWVGTFNAND